MKRMMKQIAAVLLVAVSVAACNDDAMVASRNMSKAADNFEIDRRIVFYNGITGGYLLEIKGKCSIEDQTNQLEVICKVGDQEYKKHFLGLSDNVTYFAEQVYPVKASAYHYRVTFKPQTILPDVDVRVDVRDGPSAQE